MLLMEFPSHGCHIPLTIDDCALTGSTEGAAASLIVLFAVRRPILFKEGAGRERVFAFLFVFGWVSQVSYGR